MLYTFGYQGYTPDKLKAVAEALNAIVVDIRMSPRSRNARWNMSNLVQVLGKRYVHMPAFGNRNYNTDGPIVINNLEAGAAWLLREQIPLNHRMLERKEFDNAILMCVCKDARTCHRTVLVDQLRTLFMVEAGELTETDAWRAVGLSRAQGQQGKLELE